MKMKQTNKEEKGDSGHIEGTICSKQVNWCQGDERAPLNLQWLVLRIGGTNFLHCWLVDFVWLECAESLITKRQLSRQLI